MSSSGIIHRGCRLLIAQTKFLVTGSGDRSAYIARSRSIPMVLPNRACGVVPPPLVATATAVRQQRTQGPGRHQQDCRHGSGMPSSQVQTARLVPKPLALRPRGRARMSKLSVGALGSGRYMTRPPERRRPQNSAAEFCESMALLVGGKRRDPSKRVLSNHQEQLQAGEIMIPALSRPALAHPFLNLTSAGETPGCGAPGNLLESAHPEAATGAPSSLKSANEKPQQHARNPDSSRCSSTMQPSRSVPAQEICCRQWWRSRG